MSAHKILVIDDQPINVQLLKRKLERENLQVIPAYSGKEGLERIHSDKPDLILLDVMMPDMDGIEVCQRLQSSEETRAIPVIFITARTTKESKLEGLGVGAVDYITKPIDLDETLARVQTQLRFVAINREMVDLQRRLEEARRAATIGAVTQGIAHNLNNLLGVAIGYLDLIKVSIGRPEQATQCGQHIQHVDQALQRIVAIIRQLTSLVVKARPPLVKCRLSELIGGSVDRFRQDFQRDATVVVDPQVPDVAFETNTELVEEALSKILINAWEAYGDESAEKRTINIGARLVERPGDGRFAEILIEDRGRGIDPEMADQMFEPFVSSKATVGVGMGLTMARHALRNLGGEVTVINRPGGGATAVVLHPLQPRAPIENDQAEAFSTGLPL
ncbi:MAG TPA: response regulator [Opitutaceae bacterium]|jgi:CheY-like chemotaxis protein